MRLWISLRDFGKTHSKKWIHRVWKRELCSSSKRPQKRTLALTIKYTTNWTLRLLPFNSTSYSWDLKSKRTVICGIQNFSAVFKVIWLSRELFTIMTKKNIVSASSSYKIVWIHEDYHLHFFVWFDKSVFLKVNKAFWRKHILHI